MRNRPQFDIDPTPRSLSQLYLFRGTVFYLLCDRYRTASSRTGEHQLTKPQVPASLHKRIARPGKGESRIVLAEENSGTKRSRIRRQRRFLRLLASTGRQQGRCCLQWRSSFERTGRVPKVLVRDRRLRYRSGGSQAQRAIRAAQHPASYSEKLRIDAAECIPTRSYAV